MSAPHDRARKLAAHAQYDTNEGRVARSLLARLVAEYPELAQYQVGGPSSAPAGAPGAPRKPRASRARPSEEPLRNEEVLFRSSGERRLLVVLANAHDLTWTYQQGMYPDDPHLFYALGPRSRVTAFVDAYARHRDLLAALQDAVSEAYQRAAFPSADPVTLSAADAAPHVFAAGSGDPDGWVRNALDQERRLRAARATMPEPHTATAADDLVRTAAPAGSFRR